MASNCKKVNSTKYSNNVKNNSKPEKYENIVFSFGEFKLSPINLDGEFNNYYSNEDSYINKITLFLGKALPLLSKEKTSLFESEYNKMNSIHLHKINDKSEIIEKILTEYGFPKTNIDNILEGQDLYQLEVPYINGSMRIVFQRIGNIVSFLFMDPNHHIYMNKDKVKSQNSLFYEYCPINKYKACDRLDYFRTCFAFEFLDEEKYELSFKNDYYPNTK